MVGRHEGETIWEDVKYDVEPELNLHEPARYRKLEVNYFLNSPSCKHTHLLILPQNHISIEQMVKALITDFIFVPNRAHLLPYHEPIQIDITVLDRVLRILLGAFPILLALLLLPCHALLDYVTDLLLKVVDVLKLLYGLKLHAVLAELLYVRVEVWHLHIAELCPVV